MQTVFKLVISLVLVFAVSPLCLNAQEPVQKQVLSDSSDTVTAGYYSAGKLSDIDPDLAPYNIRAGVNIFGVEGSYQPYYGVPRSGQMQSAAPGDDADQKKGFPLDGQRFTDNGNNTVTDNATGLIWIKDHTAVSAGGYALGSAFSWEKAFLAVEAINQEKYSGYSDWRLPNVKELQSIVDYGSFEPAINSAFFPNTKSEFYWTSTTYGPNPEAAWAVSFNNGYVDGDLHRKTQENFIRPVRGP